MTADIRKGGDLAGSGNLVGTWPSPVRDHFLSRRWRAQVCAARDAGVVWEVVLRVWPTHQLGQLNVFAHLKHSTQYIALAQLQLNFVLRATQTRIQYPKKNETKVTPET